jgi:DNA-binding CsgD family transcriptional regulator
VAVDLDAERILASAREVGDPALVARALMACGCFANDDREKRGAYFAEAAGLALDIGDSWWLGQILFFEATFAVLFGELVAAEAAAEEGHRIADNIGARSLSGQFRYVLAWTRILRGDLTGGLAQLREMDEDLTAARDGLFWAYVSTCQAMALAYQGHTDQSQKTAEVALERSSDSFHANLGAVHCAFGFVQLAAGDGCAAWEAFEAGREITGMYYQAAGMYTWAALAPLACGDLAAARRWADDVVSATTAWCLAAALASRARVLISQGELDAAERDARQALDIAACLGGDLLVPFALDCLAIVGADTGNHVIAARLFAAAEAARARMGMAQFKVLEAGDQATVGAVREALGANDFDSAWAQGTALSMQEAIAYAQRGRGQRKRADSGWDSLTPAELDVVRLVSDGLGNKEVAARLFISPRTVQAHLTHIYTKLGLTSRVRLTQEATRRGWTADGTRHD